MRGWAKKSRTLFSYVDLESRIPENRPQRTIWAIVNEALVVLDGNFCELYSKIGRPSIPPEGLLRAMLLQIFYAWRSERLLVERLDFNLSFLGFVGLGIDDWVWDAMTFSKNRDCLLHADGVAGDLSRPGIEGDGDIGDVGHPELVWPVPDHVLRQAREDRQVVIAIGGGDIAPTPKRLKTMLAHQASDFVMIDDKAAVPQRCLHPAVAICLESVGDRRHRLDERRVVDAGGRLVVIGRARDPHQPTSFCDGDAAGPVTTDVVTLLSLGPCFRAPFRNSISRACLPTSRSSAAMRAW